MRSLLVPLLALLTACGSSSKGYLGDRPLGLFALPDGGFLVALAEVYDRADGPEDLVLQQHAAGGARTFRTVVLRDQPRLGRVLMKRLSTGQLVVSGAGLQSVHYVSADGLTVESHATVSFAASRMKDGNDWLVGGTASDRRVHRYRLADGGALTSEITSAFVATTDDEIGDVRATGDGGVAAVIGTTVRKFDGTGQPSYSYLGGPFGQLLNEASAQVRVLVTTATESKVVTLDAGGAAVGELVLPLLPPHIWPVDNGGIAAADRSAARLLGADGATLWTLAGAFGTTPQIFSNGMRTLVASQPDESAPQDAGSVAVDDVDATGARGATVDVSKDKKLTSSD